jgi:putative addiction module component (TIGR02574 family)
MKTKKLLQMALKLNVDERSDLAIDLLKSIENDYDSEELSDEFKAELDRRLREAEAHPEDGFTWEEVKKSLRQNRKKRSAL